jgi:hypothetical protein
MAYVVDGLTHACTCWESRRESHSCTLVPSQYGQPLTHACTCWESRRESHSCTLVPSQDGQPLTHACTCWESRRESHSCTLVPSQHGQPLTQLAHVGNPEKNPILALLWPTYASSCWEGLNFRSSFLEFCEVSRPQLFFENLRFYRFAQSLILEQ